MSKAEELAKILHERYGAWHPAVPESLAAAHLRALDASHQRLKEALESLLADMSHMSPQECIAVAKAAHAALEQAKGLE